MNESEIRTDSSKYNEATIKNQQIHEEHNTAENRQVIMDAFNAGRARDVSDEPKVDKLPCFIIGSGPSLDDSIQHLKDWKGGIICTTSHALSLMRYGIEPTHILALDPFCTWEEIAGVDWSKTRTKLICTPGIWPTLIHNWPNDMLLYIQNIGRKDSYYTTYQKRQFLVRELLEGSMRNCNFHYVIRTEITSFACSPPAQMFAADILGYGNIFLAGVDFAFHSGKQRFTSWSKNADGEWVASYSFVDPDKQYPLTLNGLQSEDVHIYYKKNMISAWALSGQQMYTTDKGAIVECPYIPIAKVIEQQGQGFEKWNRETIEEHAQRYLARVGAFMVESTGGKSFVEVSDDTQLETLEKFMTEINRKIVCTSCGLEAGVNNRADGKLYDDDIKNALSMECPRCKQKAMKQPAVCDIPKQLKKFDRLLKSRVQLSA